MVKNTSSILRRVLLAAGVFVWSPTEAAAQDYNPDVMEFGRTDGLSFPADPRLSIARGGTIEFWVQPDWTDDPGYDPAIITEGGPDGITFFVALMRDREGLVFGAGEEEDVVVYDFTDNRMHHVAITQLDDGLVVYVDGRIAGTSDLKALDQPSRTFWVGGILGTSYRFRGAIAALRVWDTVISQEDIVRFAFSDVFEGQESGHPDLEHLTAISDFVEQDLMLVDGNVPNDTSSTAGKQQ